MVALSMAADEEELVLNILGSLGVEVLQILVETLPLSAFGIRLLISLVRLVDQTKVGGSLILIRKQYAVVFLHNSRSQKCWEQWCSSLAERNPQHWYS